jgi:anti-sigma B factor antagonist
MTTLSTEFAVRTERAGDGSSSVVVAGELDLYRVPELAQALQTAAASGATTINVDLSEVTFLDSTTLELLLHEHRRLAANGSVLTVLVGEQTPTTVFAVTGIDRVLNMHHADRSTGATRVSRTEAHAPTSAGQLDANPADAPKSPPDPA